MLAACSGAAKPDSTAVPASTSADHPVTVTLQPAVSAIASSETPAVAVTVDSEGQSVSAWNGIPIMPGALTGEGDSDGYVFTIQATPEQIQAYYQTELAKLGWHPLPTEDASVLMFANSAADTLTISILTQGNDSLVLLVK